MDITTITRGHFLRKCPIYLSTIKVWKLSLTITNTPPRGQWFKRVQMWWFCSFFLHGDVTKWKHFPRYWPFVRRIHRSPVNSTHKGKWRGTLMFSLICALNKQLSKQSWGWWFETPSRSLWRHCNVVSCHWLPLGLAESPWSSFSYMG